MNRLHQITLAVEEIYAGIESSPDRMHLDNRTSSATGMSEGETDMAKHRQRVMISTNDDGSPVYQWVQGDSLNELNDRIVQTYIQCGRIGEFMQNPRLQETQKPSVLLKDYVHKWMTTYKMHKLKPTSLTTYEKWLNAHILSAFGERTIASITTDDIQQFLNERKDMSSKSLTVMRNLMGEIFKDAAEDGLIEKDPTSSRRLIIPSDKVTEREALPLADFKDILCHLPKLPLEERSLLALLMLTGMRRGEALGLRWEDIDLKNNLIHVRRNVTHPQTNRPHIGTPKTKSGTRDIPLDPMLLELLMPMGSDGFIIGSEQPVSLTHYINTWSRIKKSRRPAQRDGACVPAQLPHLRGRRKHRSQIPAEDRRAFRYPHDHEPLYVHAQPEKVKAVSDKVHDLLAG